MIFLKKFEVIPKLLDPVHEHPASHASLDGGGLVEGEVDSAQVPKQNENSTQLILALGENLQGLSRLRLCDVRVTADPFELAGNS